MGADITRVDDRGDAAKPVYAGGLECQLLAMAHGPNYGAELKFSAARPWRPGPGTNRPQDRLCRDHARAS